MTEKFRPEFNLQDVQPASDPVIENFFESLRKGEPIEITEEEMEKYGLRAVGPINEGHMKFNVQGPREFAGVQQKAKVFVDQYIENFIKDINEKNLKDGKKQMEDWPKINISSIRGLGSGDYEIVVREGEMGYGRVVAFKGEGLKKAYNAYAEEYSDSEAEKLSFEEFESLFMPNVPTVCTLIVTVDNNIFLTKRSPQRVGTYKESWHVPAGYIDVSDKDMAGRLSPFVTARREIQEEVGLAEDQIDDVICLGIARDQSCGNNEFLFVARTGLRSDEIVDKNTTPDKRLLLHPKDIDGDIRPRKLVRSGKLSTTLPALLRIEKIFGNDKRGEPGPELTVPTSKALFFLVDKKLKK
ncbi:MAG: NUDIX hydrolase [bacterium]|nr:NUDIX hydrolase [bacterium]